MRRLTTAFMKKPQVPARWCPGIKKEKEKECSENYERWKKQEFFIVTRSGHVSKRNGPVYFLNVASEAPNLIQIILSRRNKVFFFV